jgi:hypothetical protein
MLFRFDSLSMISSMLLPVVAWDLLNKDRVLYALVSLIACLSFYQPAIAIFPLLVITTFIQSKKDDDKGIEYIIKSAALTIASCILYYFAVVKNTIKATEKRGDLTTGLASNIYSGIKTSISTALQSYGHIACIIIAVASLIFIMVYSKHLIAVVKAKKGSSRFVSLSLMASAPVVILICSAGVNLLLSNGYYPTRVLFPIAFIVFITLTIPAIFNDFFNRIAAYLSIALIFSSISVIYATASSLYHQQRYDSYVLFSLSEKLSSLKSEKNTYIFGVTDYSEASKTSNKVFPILDHIKNNYYDMTLSQSLVNNGIRNIRFSGQERKISYDLEKMACNGEMKLTFSMPQYSIFENENSRLIYLGGRICNK